MEDMMDSDKKGSGDLENTADGGGGKKSGSKSSSSANKHREADVLEQCTQAYEADRRPRKLGRMFAFWYNGKNEPRIVIGPDFGFSILELFLTNGILGIILNSARSQSLWALFYCGLSVLMIHNIAFIATVLCNQGLPPRNPNAHSKGYLNKVNKIE